MSVTLKCNMVVAGLVRRGGEILLVRQQGLDDPNPTWSLPGGVVEAGELLSEALAREVREETGLSVAEIGALVYAIQIVEGEGTGLTTGFVFEVERWEGQLCPADPGGFVLEAAFLPHEHALQVLGELPWRVMREPVVAYLRGEAPAGTVWLYRRAANGEETLAAHLPGAVL